MPFVKMHGLGNDFVMLRADALPPQTDLATLAQTLCDRHFGIGADGLIIAGPPSDAARADARFTYYNGDGSRAEMCGNGIRCFARFVRAQGLVSSDIMRVETDAGVLTPQLNADGSVTVDMGAPRLRAQDIPFAGEHQAPDAPVRNYPLSALGRSFGVSLVSMGNPHCVILQDSLSSPLDPAVFGPAIETHPGFPHKTNVEFVDILDRQTVRAIVWERGCGFTLACGTGACAIAVVCALEDRTDAETTVLLPGGALRIQWDKTDPASRVLMTGPAETTFEGSIDWPLRVASPERTSTPGVMAS
ncbi:MAG: diaminopimelate epimerase [Vampirovibrionales bacterium]|nr:diaminopimelate epimerase [Vampirovibrionales bacterium]